MIQAKCFFFPFARIVGLFGRLRTQSRACVLCAFIEAKRIPLTASAAGRRGDHPGEGKVYHSESDFWLWLSCAALPSALSIGRIVSPGARKRSSCRDGCCYLQRGLSIGRLLAQPGPFDFSQSPELGLSSIRLQREAPSDGRQLEVPVSMASKASASAMICACPSRRWVGRAADAICRSWTTSRQSLSGIRPSRTHRSPSWPSRTTSK